MSIEHRLQEVSGVPANASYCHAVVASGRLAFVSGQVAMDEAGNLVGEGDLGAQTRQALRNMQSVLEALGAGWADVVKLTWYLMDVTEIQVVRDVRDEFLRPALGDLPNPASTLIQAGGLFRPGYLVEVEAVVALA
ncbi:enamine deaminase RidA [Rhizocola hellebori]|uniref:Enamine deaminase RidA n=1 Tax=Rhizocola hellebori TaxID=1392758 RepID=A0A8J3QKA0_9ACTN|nr:RidA family protein [Rhizocola hellebori]GIH11270.1 enamine deaminase RidA [Rhizocola hellebori]